ncbi:tetratricopeptide repeat protein [Burkholderia cepacia]|uniref:tetratricopeptide repeat-containing glycosyltransferase family protein n=1 Tax=Burkholderia cepacia TaxID=292 RepID=UPI001CF15A99|nr:tetratricopeptide repeat-containing glycosyltransferase family protein [Burkholderia cepacia]MCA8114947.1 tetratricopeptide repeat-containing glycosyltransferase family protein [Burkholderia cepacia]MCA8401422.1 tetratricopeptide repeat-containing glycosyltransferase family protein [Burkholderia cepacia]
MTPASDESALVQHAATLCQNGRFADALSLVAPLLDRPAPAVAALHIAAVCALGLNRLVDAEAWWRRAIDAMPAFEPACDGLGALLVSQGRLADAEALLRRQLASVTPLRASHHHRFGKVLEALGRLDEAEQAFGQALLIEPQSADVLTDLGNLLRVLGRHAEAELAYRLAITVRTDSVLAHANLGAILVDMQRLPEAEAASRQALVLCPDHPEAHYNLGVALQNLDRLPEAEAAYRDAIRCRPGLPQPHNNLGCVLRAQGRHDEAMAVFAEALSLAPDMAEVHYNLGTTFAHAGRHDDAERAYRRALELRADYGDARFGLATLLLGLGRFEEGWRRYESRYEQAAFVHRRTREVLRCAQWQGEPLAGKTLLVWQEDGLGDMLQFSRYFAEFQARHAARVVFACQPALHRLMATVDGVDAVLDHETATAQAAQFDYWTSLLSAPMHTGTTRDTIPPPVRLAPDPASVARWRARLDVLPAGPRVGLVWKGNPKHHNDAHRSLPSLALLTPLWSVAGVTFVSLQKGQGEDEARQPPGGLPLLHLGSEIDDFADTAAIVAQLDLVVCVDTSTAHLAASLGKPCWVLLPNQDVDWRWMHGRDDSPWYPGTVRLFRRGRDESWIRLAERLRAAFAAHFAAGRVTADEPAPVV